MSTTPATTAIEQRAKDLVKRAYTLTAEALKETPASGARLEQLIVALTPRVFEVIANHGSPEPQAPPVTPIASNQPPVPSIPLQVQIFEEFKKRLPAELGNLFRVKDHTGTELILVCKQQLVPRDFATACRVAEELKGKRVSAENCWILPLIRPEKR